MTRIGLRLVIAAVLLQAPATRAAQLDKDSCAKLKTEQAQLEQGGTRGSMGRGPEWAKSNLAPDKLELIRRLIEVDEQLLFRCGGRPLVQLPSDPDPAAREVESKGAPAKAKKPPEAVKKPPAAEKKAVPLKKASALPAAPPASTAATQARPANAVPPPEAAPAPVPVKEAAPTPVSVTPAASTMPQPASIAAPSSPPAPPVLSKEEEDKKAAALKAARAKAKKKAEEANQDWFFNPFATPAPPAKK